MHLPSHSVLVFRYLAKEIKPLNRLHSTVLLVQLQVVRIESENERSTIGIERTGEVVTQHLVLKRKLL